jgi:hypothetical protein
MMTAIHMRTAGLNSEWSTALVEMTVSRISGVARVVAVKSMGVVSVMYDDAKANAEQILKAVRAIGFDADIHRPSE